MQEKFISYEMAVKLKKLGFDELCMAAYMKNWGGDNYILELNPLKLDDRTNEEPLKTFYSGFDYLDLTDTLIPYNFNQHFDEVDGEDNPYDEIYSAPLWQDVIDWFINVHKIWICVDTSPITFYNESDDKRIPPMFYFRIEDLADLDSDFLFHSADIDLFFEDHYKAREQAILKALELCAKKEY